MKTILDLGVLAVTLILMVPVGMELETREFRQVAPLFRLHAIDSITVCIVFWVRNVALAGAIAVTLLNRLDFAVVAVVYFLIEVPLLLGLVGAYRRWWAS